VRCAATEVADTGPGLDESQRARLFRRFEQADGARTAARHGGSGLGLAICQELARAMGGRIEVETAPGQGTRFRVFLALPAVALPETPAPRHVRESRQPFGVQVLVVEDDPVVACVVRDLLQQRGHDVVHAAHALAALAECSRTVYDIVLLDLDLPGLDGLELARLLHAQQHGLPLVALTARADAHAEADTRAAGMVGFLRKPVTGEQLADAVARHARVSGPRRDVERV
jgi:CheY-like chemotaxis protein